MTAGTQTNIQSVTDTTGSSSFTAEAYYVEIYNSGSNECYVNFGAAATVNHMEIASGETLRIYSAITEVHAICNSGESTTLQILGTIKST